MGPHSPRVFWSPVRGIASGVLLGRLLGSAPPHHRHKAQPPSKAALLALSIAAVAQAAVAMGAVAVGALAVRRLAVRSAAIGRLRIQRLEVDRLSLGKEGHTTLIAEERGPASQPVA